MKIAIEDIERVKYISVDGKVFDWPNQCMVEEIEGINRNSPFWQKGIYVNLHDDFIKRFSEFVGRDVNYGELVHAIKTGEL